MTDHDSLAKAVEQVKKEYGSLDVLMNNSGISNVDGDLTSPSVIDVNLYGVHDTIEAFLPLLSPHSLLVTVSSEVGAWTTQACPLALQQKLMAPEKLDWPSIVALQRTIWFPSRRPVNRRVAG